MLHGLTDSASDPAADPDGDGKSNLRELPEAPDPTSGIGQTGRSRVFSNGMCLPQTALRHGLKVWLNSSSNLSNWTRQESFDLPELLEDDYRYFPFQSDLFARFEVKELQPEKNGGQNFVNVARTAQNRLGEVGTIITNGKINPFGNFRYFAEERDNLKFSKEKARSRK